MNKNTVECLEKKRKLKGRIEVAAFFATLPLMLLLLVLSAWLLFDAYPNQDDMMRAVQFCGLILIASYLLLRGKSWVVSRLIARFAPGPWVRD